MCLILPSTKELLGKCRLCLLDLLPRHFPPSKNLTHGENMTVSEQPTVHLPDQPLRHTVVILLRQTLEQAVETEHLIDWVEDLWETIDILVQRFGEAEANKIIHARLATHSFVGGFNDRL